MDLNDRPGAVRSLPARAGGVATLGETLVAFAAVTAAVSYLYRVRSVPFIERNLSVIAAVLFLYVPALLLWRRHRELERYGLRLPPLRRGLLLWGLLCLTVLPLFSLGYVVYIRAVCGHLPRWLVWCLALPSPALRLPPQLLMTALSQLIVVALPEEFFFRGYLQGRLADIWPERWAVPAAALLFALGHYLVTFEPAALAVFFPGLLFGLLRAHTGSILAGTLFHATCNLLIDVLHRSLG